MINIKKYVISEAFEQLSRSAKLNESSLFDEKDILHKIDQFQSSITIDRQYEKQMRKLLDTKHVNYQIDDRKPGKLRFQLYYPKSLRKLEELDESKLTEAPLTPKEYADKMRAKKAVQKKEEESDMHILDRIDEKITARMSPSDQLQVFFDELVPESGPANSVGGEIVRAMMRLLYRDFNDGDLWYTGYGKETCGPSVLYLIKEIPDLDADFQEIAAGSLEGDSYTDALNDITIKVIDYLYEFPELLTESRDFDSRNTEGELEDYFHLPTYEFDVDASYDESYYSVSDEEIDDFIHSIVESDFRGATVNRWASDGWTIENLDKEQLEYLEDVWERWFRDFLIQHEKEEPEEEEEKYYDEDEE